MAKFVLLYTGGSEPTSEAEGAAVMQAWMGWFNQLGAAVVDGGNPLGSAVKSIASDGSVGDGLAGPPVTGYSIVTADSLDAAVALAKSCPHLQAGGTVNVYEAIEMM